MVACSNAHAIHEVFATLITCNDAVTQHHDTSRMRRDVGFVRDHDDRLTLARRVPRTRFMISCDVVRVEVTRGFVGQEDGRTVDERARNGDTLTLTAGQFVGTVMQARTELHGSSASVARRLRSSAEMPAYTSGSSTFCSAVARGSRLNVWKTKPISLLRTRASWSSLIVGHEHAVEPVLAAVRRVEAADQVHERGLARTGRSHDGDVFVRADGEVDAAQCAHDFATHVVLALEPARDDDPVLAPASSQGWRRRRVVRPSY